MIRSLLSLFAVSHAVKKKEKQKQDLPAHADWPRAIAIAFLFAFRLFLVFGSEFSNLPNGVVAVPWRWCPICLPDEQFPFRRETTRPSHLTRTDSRGPRGCGFSLAHARSSMGPSTIFGSFAGLDEKFANWNYLFIDACLMWRSCGGSQPQAPLLAHSLSCNESLF